MIGFLFRAYLVAGPGGHTAMHHEARVAMAQYWVVGGEYADTRFDEINGQEGEQWFGPFGDYEVAKQEWAKRAWRTVDECNTRYRIERIDPDVPPPCTD